MSREDIGRESLRLRQHRMEYYKFGYDYLNEELQSPLEVKKIIRQIEDELSDNGRWLHSILKANSHKPDADQEQIYKDMERNLVTPLLNEKRVYELHLLQLYSQNTPLPNPEKDSLPNPEKPFYPLNIERLESTLSEAKNTQGIKINQQFLYGLAVVSRDIHFKGDNLKEFANYLTKDQLGKSCTTSNNAMTKINKDFFRSKEYPIPSFLD